MSESQNENQGVKELTEVLVGAQEISLVAIKHLKDGIQLGKDAALIVGEILSNDELKKALMDAADGISKLPDEIKDLDAAEVAQLAVLEISYVPKFIEAFKK